MDFTFTDEQRQLGDSIEKFLSKEYGFEARKAIVASDAGWSRKVWAQFADMGLLGLAIAEEHGGLGTGPEELIVALTALGRHLVVEPYVPCAILAPRLIAEAGTAAQCAALLPAIASGESLVTAALFEPGERYSLTPATTKARRDGSAWVLDGAKSVVPFGAQADAMVVSAACDDGPGLFLVRRGASGLALRDSRTLDGLRVADIGFTAVAAERLGSGGSAANAISAATDFAIAAVCNGAVGTMEGLNAQTLEYLKTRQQFGQPIGRFQALQHRAVDMFIHCEQSKSIAWLAMVKAMTATHAERGRAVAAAKVHIGRSARAVSQSGVQLHGGIGVTNELAAAHYAKHLTLLDFTLGDAEHHLDRFVAAG